METVREPLEKVEPITLGFLNRRTRLGDPLLREQGLLIGKLTNSD